MPTAPGMYSAVHSILPMSSVRLLLASVRSLLRRTFDARPWRPAHARLLWFQVARRKWSSEARLSDDEHLTAAAAWLERAQDVMTDGGVCGRYTLSRGWTSSYPETTGYVIPTFLALAREFGEPRFNDRAARCVAFLLSLQLPEGAFPAGEVRENTRRPSVFNTAQVLSGLVAWHAFAGDPLALAAAARAANWLVSVQGTDGGWYRHVYAGVAATYTAFASCCLAEFGEQIGEPEYLAAADRHLTWSMRHCDPATGWFDLAGFTREEHAARRAMTHTIAYTLMGVLRSSEVVGRSDGIAAVGHAAAAIVGRLERSRWLPGMLDHRWRGRSSFACLTGNAQLALLWFRLHQRHGASSGLVNAAVRALNLVKRGQLMFSDDPNLRGGIPGSDPLWGGYLTYALPNWAAKFFIDAMLERRRSQAGFSTRPDDAGEVPDDVPESVPISSVGARSPGARSGAHLERLLPGWPSRSEGR